MRIGHLFFGALSVSLLAGLFAPDLGHATAAPNVKVMSYNIRNTDDDANGSWNQRFAGMQKVINDANPDILALSETDMKNLKSLDASYAGKYARVALANPYPSKVVFWDVDRFTALASGTVGHPTNCAGQNRSVTWVHLDDKKNSNTFFVVLAHLSTNRDGANCLPARRTEVTNIHALIASTRPAGARTIVAGDLNNETTNCSNATQGAPIDMLGAPQPSYNLNATPVLSIACTSANATMNHGWDALTSNDGKRIDYIFFDSNTLAPGQPGPGIDKRLVSVKGVMKSPSDHYAVWAILQPL